MVSLIYLGKVSLDDLLNLQDVTSKMPKMGFFYLSIAYSVMDYPLNTSSLKGIQIQSFNVVAFMEIQNTSNMAYKLMTSKINQALFHPFSTFVAYVRQSLMSC